MERGIDKLVAAAQQLVAQLSPGELARAPRLGMVVVDVREIDEVEEGRIPGAVHLPRGRLELHIDRMAGSASSIVLYCQSGVRSLLAAKTLKDMGYAEVRSLEGGVEAWKEAGLPLESVRSLSMEARRRYSRQLNLPELGEEGQLKLQEARVLVVGAGGLGSPALMYLSGAGVGTLGIVDDDRVDLSNLHRQVIHRTEDIGTKKVESAARGVRERNPLVQVLSYDCKIDASNVDNILGEGWDVVIDGTDRIPTRYLLSDACAAAGIALVYGAVHTFEGQVTVFAPHQGGPCYRCFFPVPPAAAAVPNCAEAGVVGVVPGLVGLLQALQVVHLVAGTGDALVGRVVRFDGRQTRVEELRLGRDPDCTVCQRHGPPLNAANPMP